MKFSIIHFLLYQDQINPFPVLGYSVMLRIEDTPIGMISIFMQFFFKSRNVVSRNFFLRCFYIFINSPYRLDAPYHAEPFHQKGRACLVNIMGTTHAAGIPLGIMHLQGVILTPTVPAFPDSPCLLACQGKSWQGLPPQIMLNGSISLSSTFVISPRFNVSLVP